MDNWSEQIIIIYGLGHLGSCFLKGFIKAGVPPNSIVGLVRDENKAIEKYSHTNIHITSHLETLSHICHKKRVLLFICVRTISLKSCLEAIASYAYDLSFLIISCCASVTYAQITTFLQNGLKSSRPELLSWAPRVGIVMPSIAIGINQGCSVFCAMNLNVEDANFVTHILNFISDQIIHVSNDIDVLKSNYICGAFPGIISHILDTVDKILIDEGVDLTHVRCLLPSILQCMGSYYTSPLFESTLQHFSPLHISNSVSLLLRMQDFWPNVLNAAIDASFNRQLEISKTLD